MNKILKNALVIAGFVSTMAATSASAQVTLFEHDGFDGRSFTTATAVGDLWKKGFNDRASSVVVLNQRWEVCDDKGYQGRCAVLRPGRYDSLARMGLNDRVSSVRAVGQNAWVDDNRYAPMAEPVYDNHRRGSERLFQAEVTSVRAVVGPPEQRCWTEQQQTEVQDRGRNNVGGAIAGALIGGILGHQIGGGRGQDIATAGGAVAGAAIGNNAGRDQAGSHYETRDVQRCANTPNSSRPEFWDVTYNFRGQEHRIQMTYPPGNTVTVNRQGEPRA